MNTSILKSRKFWAALSGLVIVVLNSILGKEAPFTAEQLTGVVVMLASYILGVAIEDAGGKKETISALRDAATEKLFTIAELESLVAELRADCSAPPQSPSGDKLGKK